jgi:hypothetical protein
MFFKEEFIKSINEKLEYYFNEIEESKNLFEKIKSCNIKNFADCKKLYEYIKRQAADFIAITKDEKNYLGELPLIEAEIFEGLRNSSPNVFYDLVRDSVRKCFKEKEAGYQADVEKENSSVSCFKLSKKL